MRVVRGNTVTLVCLLVALIGVCLVSTGARSDVLVVDDPLQGSTIGIREGGEFAGGGWHVLGTFDAIYWHLPYPIPNGAAEFRVRGIDPNEGDGQMADKTELFHMYDWLENNSDTDYNGYRGNYYKHFVRKSGNLNGAKTDSLELLMKIGENYQEPDTAVLSWNPATEYVFRIEWAPDASGFNTEIRIYRDGVLLYTMSEPYSYLPPGHCVRIGASSRRLDGTSAPINAVFSYFKVWDNSSTPRAPEILLPRSGRTVGTLTPRVHWQGDASIRYQVRISTANDPNTGIVWDSGQVSSRLQYADTGALSNLSTYYVFVRIANGIGWGPWSPAGHSLTVNTSYQANPGLVRVNGSCFQDDRGDFLALGATYMSAMRHCRGDRDRFRSCLAFLSSRGFDYVRILTMVGWDGRQIVPYTYQDGDVTVYAWGDYWQQFRDTIDIIYSYGMRTEVTIFADAQQTASESVRYSHMDQILANLAGREHKVILIEVANESWQNGFPLPGGVDTVRTFGAYLAARTNIPIALSSPYDTSDDGIRAMYSGSAADIATVHFDRNTGTFEGGWLPVRDCWRAAALYPEVPPVSSNEPVGPGSSVSTENDPIKLVSAACFAWVAKLPTYVFHSKAGVYSELRFEAMSGINDYRCAKDILPNDLPNWRRNDGIEAAAPFTAYCGSQSNKYWTEVSGQSTGCHRNIGATKGKQFVCYPQGILSGGVKLQARKALDFTVYNPLTCAVVSSGSLSIGQDLTLTQGPGAYIIKGTFTGIDATPPASVEKFSVNPADGHNVLTWRNPTDEDFYGAKVVCRTDTFPSGPADGTPVCDLAGTAGANAQYTHSGLANGTRYYYAAFAYDDNTTPNYSSPATAVGTPVAGQCFSDRFTYPDGNLHGNRSWSGATQIQVLSDAVRITGGADNVTIAHPVSCSGGLIRAHATVKAGSGVSTLWGIWIDDANGNNLARWYGTGVTARARIGDTSSVLPAISLTGGWDNLEVRINTASNTSDFYFNGSFLGTLSHTGAGDSAGRVRLERVYNSTAGDSVSLDNLVIGPAGIDSVPPGPVTGFSGVSQESQVDLSWTNPTDADFAGVKVLYKATGYPTDPYDGTQLYDGAATQCVHANAPGGVAYYAAYAYDWAMNLSAAATTSVVQPGQDCYAEGFAYADGNLNGAGDWTGSATSQIAVEGETVRIGGGAGLYDSTHPVTCTGSPLGVRLKVARGSGTAAIWSLYIDDTSGVNLGRWYGTGTTVRGRIGAGVPTSVGTLTGGWDELYVKVDFAQNKTQFVFNGTVLGTLNHTAGDAIGWIRLERLDTSTATGQYVLLDDISIGPADVTAPSGSIGAPSAQITRTGPVSFAVDFDEPVFGFNSTSDVQVNATGSAAAGTVNVTGAGAGPYSVVLSGVTGGGTLGIDVKASACVDVAGNANLASSSALFAVLSEDGLIATARQAANGAAVALAGKVLYLKSGGFGYIEEPDRSCGMRIQGAIPASEGDVVCLSGTVSTNAFGERLIELGALSSAGPGSLKPLGMNASALRAAAACGLYARVWGVVKNGSVTGSSYVLSQADGSEVKVYTRGVPAVQDGDFAVVSGAMGLEDGRVVYEK